MPFPIAENQRGLVGRCCLVCIAPYLFLVLIDRHAPWHTATDEHVLSTTRACPAVSGTPVAVATKGFVALHRHFPLSGCGSTRGRDIAPGDANLRRAIFSGTLLFACDLSNAILSNANLTVAIATTATLSGVDFSRAILARAAHSEADPRESPLCEANLVETDLTAARYDSMTVHHCPR